MIRLSRRGFVGGTVAAGAVLGAPAILRGQAAMPRITYVTLATGFSVLLNEYMAAKRFDLKHGVNLDVINSYTSVGNYYNDFVSGSFDFGIGSWDTFATRYIAGVPIKLVSNVTTAHLVNMVAPGDGAGSAKELAGKTVAAPLNSGTYRLTKLMLKEFHNLELEKDIQVQNVESPAAAVTLVVANRANAGLSWEPNISVGMSRMPSMKVIYNLGQDFKQQTGREMPFFAFAIQKAALDKNPGVAAKLAATFQDCIGAMVANPDEAIAMAAPKMNVAPEVLKLAFTSGRLAFNAGPMGNAEARASVQAAADFLTKHGVLPKKIDDGFYAV